jgi:hypothetical protein
VSSIKRGRGIDSATIQRRREQAAYVDRAANARRAREADPYRTLTEREERVLRRFGHDPITQDGVQEDEE